MRTIACTLGLSALVAACLPVTTATVVLGRVTGEAQMREAERVVESLGFCRLTFVLNTGERTDRLQQSGRLVSDFESCPQSGFGASVVLVEPSNELQVVLAERNTRFSAKGEALLEDAHIKLKERFGSGITLTR